MKTAMWAAFGLAGWLVAGTVSGSEGTDKPASERYQRLLKAYDAPLRVYNQDPEKAKTACQPFLKLARENPSDPIAVDALHWVVTHTVYSSEAGQAMDLLAKDHVKSDKLASTCRVLDRLYGGDFKPLELMLRSIVATSPHREVKGLATLALARRLKNAKENAQREKYQHELFLKGAAVSYVRKPSLNDADLEKLSEESAALFDEVVEKYGDLKTNAGLSLKETAERETAELLGLEVGKVAPEIEGRDLDGKLFKLSDYRGKVVVLNFWNHSGCPVCRALYPEDRALIERQVGSPFVLLGINSGDEPAELARLRKQGQIPWRFWMDGNHEEGPIAKRWNIRGWPTIYVIDRSGVIRNKGFLQGETLSRAVEELVQETASGKK